MDKKEYIEREVAKNAIYDYILSQTVSKYPSSELCKASRGGAEGAMYELDYVPAADVAPVVHGEWLYEKDGCWQCSACKQSHFMNISKGYHPICEGYYYCPHCGAKMDGGEK